MLNALTLGAKELASSSQITSTFPTKMLPPILHQKYSELEDNVVQTLLQDISKKAIDRGHLRYEGSTPFIRERQLRVRPSAKISLVEPNVTLSQPLPSKARLKFTDVAAENFILPLINRFWLFFNNEQMREERTRGQSDLYRYRASGTGLILNPLVLSHFIASLAVLIDSAKNASQWLALIAPNALELAVTLGTKRVSRLDEEEDENQVVDPSQPNLPGAKEAKVLTATMELALIVLDGCLELDGGRSLSLDHSVLLLGTADWADLLFARLDNGARFAGGGGAQESRLRRAVAGTVLKVNELISRWRRSMVDSR